DIRNSGFVITCRGVASESLEISSWNLTNSTNNFPLECLQFRFTSANNAAQRTCKGAVSVCDLNTELLSPAVPKRHKSTKSKIPVKHPPVIDMLKASIKAAKDRKCTSLPTVKKFIAANYKVDVEKRGPHIR
ncbi:Histone H1, partial [Clonorchis sinensis]